MGNNMQYKQDVVVTQSTCLRNQRFPVLINLESACPGNLSEFIWLAVMGGSYLCN